MRRDIRCAAARRAFLETATGVVAAPWIVPSRVLAAAAMRGAD